MLAIASMLATMAHAADPVRFRTYARVDVDASGRVAAVQLDDPALPAPVGALLAAQVEDWAFEPAKRGDAPQASSTWLALTVRAEADAAGALALHVEDAFAGPRPLEQPAPKYPSAALQRGIQGEVLLRFRVEPDGSVGEVDVVEGADLPALPQAAKRALRKWRFDPERVAGKPVATTMLAPIAFRVRGGGPIREAGDKRPVAQDSPVRLLGGPGRVMD